MCETGPAGQPIGLKPGRPGRRLPHHRRARVILIGDEIFTKVDGYVLGDSLTSVIAGTGARARLPVYCVPHPVPPRHEAGFRRLDTS
jgi:hypothetical protein